MSTCGYDLNEPQDIIEYILQGANEDFSTRVAVRRDALAAIERLQNTAWCKGLEAAANHVEGIAQFYSDRLAEEIRALESPYEKEGI